MAKANTEENYATQPRWVRERRYGIHGIDHMKTGALDHDPVPDSDALYWNYCEKVHGLDENIARVLDALVKAGGMENTLVIDELEASGGLQMPVRRPAGEPYHDRKLPR